MPVEPSLREIAGQMMLDRLQAGDRTVWLEPVFQRMIDDTCSRRQRHASPR